MASQVVAIGNSSVRDTHKLDTRALARCAAVLAQRPDCERFIKPLASDEQRSLQALVLRRRQLGDKLTSERQRLHISRRSARHTPPPRAGD